jgi:hypothetical protein
MRRVWKILAAVICFSGTAAIGEQCRILSRFSSWAVVRTGVTLSSDSGNLGVGCTDDTMTYMTLVKITDHSSIVWRPDVKAFYFNFTAWADAGPPSDFSLLVADKSDASCYGNSRSKSGLQRSTHALLGDAQRGQSEILIQHAIAHCFEYSGFGAGHCPISGGRLRRGEPLSSNLA